MSPAYLILIVLIITGGLLTLLLLPLPNFGTRILLGLLHKLNSPLLFWPTRIVVGFVLISFFCTVDLQVFANLVVSITEMTKYESKLQDLHTDGLGRKDLLISKWRSERNFYLHCFAVVLLCITWGVQHIVYTNHKLEEELAKNSPKSDRKPKVA